MNKDIVWSGLPAHKSTDACAACGTKRDQPKDWPVKYALHHLRNANRATYGRLEITCPKCGFCFAEATHAETKAALRTQATSSDNI